MDSNSQVNKINLISPINVDPIPDGVWSFEDEAQHVQNTGFVFDDGVANLNLKTEQSNLGADATTKYMYSTADGDTVTVGNSGSTNSIYINGNFIDNVNYNGIQEAYRLSGIDAVIADDGSIIVLKVTNLWGTASVTIEKWVSNVLTATNTFSVSPFLATTNAQFGIVRKVYGRNLMLYNNVDIFVSGYSFTSSLYTFEIFNSSGASVGRTSGINGPSFASSNSNLSSTSSVRLTCIQLYNTLDYVIGANGFVSPGVGLPFQMLRNSAALGGTFTLISGGLGTASMESCFLWHQYANGYNAVVVTGQNSSSGGLFPANTVVRDIIGYTSLSAAPYSFAAPGTVAYTGNLLNLVTCYNALAFATDNNAAAATPYWESPTISSSISKITDTPITIASRDVYIRRAILQTNFNDSTRPYLFCYSFYKQPNLSTSPGSPMASSFISVAMPVSTGVVGLGVPISQFGNIDISFMPVISSDYTQILWAELDGTFKVVKIGNTGILGGDPYPSGPFDTIPPIRPNYIQKISNNLYKINSIDPINIIDKTTNTLELGSNDYSGQMRTVFTSAIPSTEYTTSGSLLIQSKYANSLDFGDQTIKTMINPSPAAGSQSFTLYNTLNIGSEINPLLHNRNNYFFVTAYDNGRVTGYDAGIPFYDQYGRSFGGLPNPTSSSYPRVYEFQPYLKSVNSYPTHTKNITLPIPITTLYTGSNLPTNSSAVSYLYNKSYITSGYTGTTITSDYDGYLPGNDYNFAGDIFTLYSQGYLYDGKSVYAITFSGNYINKPLNKVIDANGLRYIGYSPELAFFYSDMDRSLWAFDGGRTLQKIKKLDGFPPVYKAMYNTKDDALCMIASSQNGLDAKIIWYREGRTTSNNPSLIPINYTPYFNVPMPVDNNSRLYNTQKGLLIQANGFGWNFHFSYTTESATTNSVVSIVPFTIQTGYLGPSSNKRMILSAITFGVYNEDKTPISFDVQVLGYDQDKLYTMKSQTFRVNQADYINGGIFRARVQDMNPQRVLAASFKLSTTSKIRIFELQYHWKEDVQALLPGGRSK